MKFSLFPLCVLSAALTACGGGDSAPSSSASAHRVFAAPPAGTKLTYAETVTDNLDNTINRTIVETISEVHADGSFAATTRDPSNDSTFLGAENYTYYPTVFEFDAAGQTKQAVTYYPDGTSEACFMLQSSSSPSQPDTWNSTYTKTCGTRAPVTYTRIGAYLGTETVTVPAGTFNADKFQNTYTRTNTAGTTITETITAWDDPSSAGSIAIKRVANYAYSGAAATPNSIISLTRVLQSRQ